ncbi:MAG: CBS domain-containing protein [Myxococcales bacterium]|nr:CBS domain-containing protein [Myxococcales bacterium]MCB9644759.1 CBS domain-containing protein [Myxococcales bacterium]
MNAKHENALHLSPFRVNDLMTHQVTTLLETETMDLAQTLMRAERIRHLPVVDAKGRLAGLVTHRDLLRVSVSEVAEMDPEERIELLQAIPVMSMMQRNVRTVSPMTSLREAAQLLLEHKYGCLPVVNEHRELIGILTESDFVKLFLRLFEDQDD